MYRKKTTIIIVMCIAVLIMGVGYALLSTQLDIGGSTAVTSSWKVEFSDIRTVSMKGGATNKVSPNVTSTTASFSVDLVQPGDEITYEIDITNYGDIKAEIKGATYTITGSEAIYIEIDGIRKGAIIESCEGLENCPTITAVIKVGYDPSVEKDPTEKTKDIEITLSIGQYVPGNPTADGELIPELKVNETLVQQILRNNTVQSDGNIDFSQASSDTNGKGLYFTSQNTENNQVTYYFRGAVENNYVSFGTYQESYTITNWNNQEITVEKGDPIIWRIVRINEDGSIRLINQNSIAISSFVEENTVTFDNANVGYMYGNKESNTYKLTHENKNDSVIKKDLDNWYKTNLSSYSNLIFYDAGFCNDRSVASTEKTWASDDTALGYGNNTTYYGAYNRLVNLKKPQFACPNEEKDLFTYKTSTKGNKALEYPIGMLTVDEIAYAGSGFDTDVNNTYLNNNGIWWTMSPMNNWKIFNVDGHGSYNDYPYTDIWNGHEVRPVINLKADVAIVNDNSDGSIDRPYKIKID